MKKLILTVLVMLCSPAFAEVAGSCDTLVITGHPDYPPVAWAADGEIVGASTELVASIAKKLKVQSISSKDFGSWDNAQKAIKSGQADVIFGIYKNEVRQRYMNYIEPSYMVDPVSIVVRKEQVLKYEKWADLIGLKGVTNEGESYGNKFDSYITEKLTVDRLKGAGASFDALLNRQGDYLIIGLYPGTMEARKRNIMSKLEFLPQPLVVANMYIAFSKKSKCYESLKEGFSAAITQARSSGKVKRLLIDGDKKFNSNVVN